MITRPAACNEITTNCENANFEGPVLCHARPVTLLSDTSSNPLALGGFIKHILLKIS